jgi:hypothetical protein
MHAKTALGTGAEQRKNLAGRTMKVEVERSVDHRDPNGCPAIREGGDE